jgi:hypothetical protein
MRYFILFITTLIIFSCGNKKVLQLPEISNSDITEITDVSAAYLFYNETQPDSVELNRKNLISTTNWLINVDKRLTLKQAIPHIKFLQDKKLSSSHKNENAKNYFTCHDLSRNNLGFLEFSELKYEIIDKEKAKYVFIQPKRTKKEYRLDASYHARSTLSIIIDIDKKITFHDEIVTINQLSEKLVFFVKEYNFLGFSLDLFFDQNLTFQDYASIKSELNSLRSEVIGFGYTDYIIN